MDLHRVDTVADLMDYLDNFAALQDKLAAVVTRDQMLDLVERLANYSTAGLLVVVDLDCQIFDLDRSHGRYKPNLTDYMNPDCNYYHGHLVVVSN